MATPEDLQLSPKHQRFVDEYMLDANATQAAVRAGYSPHSAQQIGYQLLHLPALASAIRQARAQRHEQLQISAERVLRELGRIAFADVAEAYDEHGRLKPLGELPPHLRSAIAGVTTMAPSEALDGPSGANQPPPKPQVRVRWHDKLRALDLIGRHFRMFTSVHEVTVAAAIEQAVLRFISAVPVAQQRARTGSTHEDGSEAASLGTTRPESDDLNGSRPSSTSGEVSEREQPGSGMAEPT